MGMQRRGGGGAHTHGNVRRWGARRRGARRGRRLSPGRLAATLRPGCNPGANLKSISHRCHPILVAFVWKLARETIELQGGCAVHIRQFWSQRQRSHRIGGQIYGDRARDLGSEQTQEPTRKIASQSGQQEEQLKSAFSYVHKLPDS